MTPIRFHRNWQRCVRHYRSSSAWTWLCPCLPLPLTCSLGLSLIFFVPLTRIFDFGNGPNADNIIFAFVGTTPTLLFSVRRGAEERQ